MKKYMVVVVFEGEQSAHFTDDYASAYNIQMDAECGLGAYAEMYAYVEDEDYGNSYVLF